MTVIRREPAVSQSGPAPARPRWRRAAMWASWLATRSALYLFATVRLFNGRLGYRGDVGLYQSWYETFISHGLLPVGSNWQYPPAAAVIFWMAGRLGGDYLRVFALLAIGADLLVLLMLTGRARYGGSTAGAWYWVWCVPLVGTVLALRFDIFSVALAVAALCLARTATGRGLMAGAGAAVKLWPVTLLAGMPPGRGRRGVLAAAASCAAITFALALVFKNALGFVGNQAARGVEIEAVAATPFMIGRLFGWPVTIGSQYGSEQLTGPGVRLAEYACFAGLLAAVAAVLGWRWLMARGRLVWRSEFACDAPLTVTLLVLVTSRVLSPQYMLWLVGLAACCLAAGRTTQRPVAVLVAVAAAATQVEFPIGWSDLLHGSGVVTLDLTARNLILVLAAAVSCWRLARASLPRRDPVGSPQAATSADRLAW